MLRRLFRADPARDAARSLYAEAVARARDPAFYGAMGVPDTVDGRFDMLVLHLWLLMRRLRLAGAEGAAVSQALADAMAADMDGNLREMGISDLSVAKRMGEILSAFRGRLAAYDEAVEAGGGPALAGAVDRNVFGSVASDPAGAARVAADAEAVAAALATRPAAALLGGRAGFPPVSA
jgi:cytochrome b pre-mRNA-processing protein 3